MQIDRLNCTDIVVLPSALVGLRGDLLQQFPQLYCLGDVSLFLRNKLAVLVTSQVSDNGMRRAARVARSCAHHENLVISGVDTEIHRTVLKTAIAFGGRAIAVLATPLDALYPPQQVAMLRVLARDHLVVSPFPLGSNVGQANDSDRNRILAQLAAASYVIEAGDHSRVLQQVRDSVAVQHPVYIAEELIADDTLTWPAHYLAEHPSLVYTSDLFKPEQLQSAASPLALPSDAFGPSLPFPPKQTMSKTIYGHDHQTAEELEFFSLAGNAVTRHPSNDLYAPTNEIFSTKTGRVSIDAGRSFFFGLEYEYANSSRIAISTNIYYPDAEID